MHITIEKLGCVPHFANEIIRYMEVQWGHYYRANVEAHDWQEELFFHENSLPITLVALIHTNEKQTLAGFASLNIPKNNGYIKEAWLERVYVPESYRGLGIAKKLVQALCRLATLPCVDGTQVQSLQLRTLSAKDLYLKCNWRELGTELYRGMLVTRMAYDLAYTQNYHERSFSSNYVG